MANLLMQAEGEKGQLLKLFDDRIIIARKVGLFRASREKTILLEDIAAIEFSPAKKWRKYYGFIRFSFKGGQETKSQKFRDIEKDPHAIVFNFRKVSQFEKIKEAIEKRMNTLQERGSKSSDLDDLEKLAKLRDKGIITKEEFEAKKKQILDIR